MVIMLVINKILTRIHKPEAQAKGMVIHKNLNRIHKPEAQANGMVIMLVINKNPYSYSQA
ncbi:MAG: hypothetical protein RL553_493 [Planctomycetota bacterium]|jgi:hypothetical protein